MRTSVLNKAESFVKLKIQIISIHRVYNTIIIRASENQRYF